MFNFYIVFPIKIPGDFMRPKWSKKYHVCQLLLGIDFMLQIPIADDTIAVEWFITFVHCKPGTSPEVPVVFGFLLFWSQRLEPALAAPLSGLRWGNVRKSPDTRPMKQERRPTSVIFTQEVNTEASGDRNQAEGSSGRVVSPFHLPPNVEVASICRNICHRFLAKWQKFANWI